MTGRPLAGILLGLLIVGPLLADEAPKQPAAKAPETKPEPAKLPNVTAFDKTVIDSLREVHNRGADLYNLNQNFDGAYRMYQGGLVTVRPLLAHRPAAQKLIDDGLENADKEMTPAKRARKLHETIEAVRKYLKDVNEPVIKTIAPEPEPKTKPKVKEPPIVPIAPEPKVKEVPETKKAKDPVEPAPKSKEPDPVKKPKDPTETKKSPPVEEKKSKVPDEPKAKEPVEIKAKNPDPMGVKPSGPSGKVTLKGQPLTAAEVTVVSLDQKQPRVFTAVLQAAGTYKFAEALPPGRYVVIVTAKNVPEKYQLTTTSGLMIEVKAGTTAYDIELK